jgi:hypothetical protein
VRLTYTTSVPGLYSMEPRRDRRAPHPPLFGRRALGLAFHSLSPPGSLVQQAFLGRLKYALPGWEEAESRRAAERGTWARDGGQLEATRQAVGLATAGGLAEISAGVMGTAATWVASTGSRARERYLSACRGLGSVVGRPLLAAGCACTATALRC